MMSTLFYIVAAFALFTGAMVAFRPKPIESALWLIANFFATSALYVLLGSFFVAVIQVLVYAGAILVLFTFVILLLNLDPKDLGLTNSMSWVSFVLLLGCISAVLLCLHVATPNLLKSMPEISDQNLFGSIENFSMVLIGEYAWSFEVAGVLLLLAVVGVGLLAYRKPLDPLRHHHSVDSNNKEAA